MAKVGAQRAAVLTGKSKSTIQRAMNSGKLSFELDQNDRRIIDVSELERAFGIKQTSPQPSPSAAPTQKKQAVEIEAAASIETLVEKERLSMQIKMLEQQLSTANEQIDDLKDQRNKWERQASQVLITSQYSQRQAEELKAQIKEREERARQRRLQNAKVQTAQTAASNQKKMSPPPANRSKEAQDLDSQMQKLKAQNENITDSSPSVFRFWKKAKG